MTNAAAKIEAVDAELIVPGLTPDKIQDLMKQRAEWVARQEVAEAEWLEASEAYEAAVAEA